jgi:PAS domain S-box-containing protein
MKNALPTSIVMVNKEERIVDWNRRAAEMLGLDFENATPPHLASLEIMEKERVREGFIQCFQEKKPVTIKSVSLKNPQGSRYLTDIFHIPIIDSAGEIQGAFMIMSDISDIAEIQATFERQKEELLGLEQRYQEAYAKLKLSDIEKNAICDDLLKVRTELESKTQTAGHVNIILEEKKRELETTNELITSKVHELNDVTRKLNGMRLEFDALQIEKKKQEVEKTPFVSSEDWKDKLKIYAEIDRWLNCTDDGMKTKKIKETEEK